jgi:hypothetical protein
MEIVQRFENCTWHIHRMLSLAFFSNVKKCSFESPGKFGQTALVWDKGSLCLDVH